MSVISEILKKFEPATLGASLDKLPADVQAALPHLKSACAVIDTLMRRQWADGLEECVQKHYAAAKAEPGNAELSEMAKALKHFNAPYNTLEAHSPFSADAPRVFPGKALYPTDLTAEDFDAYLDAHPTDREALLSPYTVVVRDGDALKAVPYHEYFSKESKELAQHLNAAANVLDDSHKGLKTFLHHRADALEGKYGMPESDADWVRLVDTPLEVVVGPFEVYSDDFKGQKAFYEAMILATDPEAGAALNAIEAALPKLQAEIPCPNGSKPAVGGMAPMIVVDELLAAGEGRQGVLTSAFNLPNDADVRAQVGWKQVMIRNVMQAKFDHCTRPIAARVLTPEDFACTSFDAYFFHVLLHEVTHGLGPAYRADGRRVSEACGRWHTPIEEAKADIGSLVLQLLFQGTCGIPKIEPISSGTSFFAGLCRSIRFGIHEAHGRANVIQYSFLREKGALIENNGRLHVVVDRLLPAAKELLQAICTLQASGTEAELQSFVETYGTPSAELQNLVDGLNDLPIDILATFPLD